MLILFILIYFKNVLHSSQKRYFSSAISPNNKDVRLHSTQIGKMHLIVSSKIIFYNGANDSSNQLFNPKSTIPAKKSRNYNIPLKVILV